MQKKISSLKDKLKNQIPGKDLEESSTYFRNFKKRIILSEISQNGLNDMYEYSILPEFYDYMDIKAPKTKNDTSDYIKKLLDRNKNGYKGGLANYWFINEIITSKVIGTIGLVGIDIENKNAEIGYGLSPAYWGSGMIFEALWLIIKYSFETLKLENIHAEFDLHNLRTISVLKAVGFEENKGLEANHAISGKKKKDLIHFILYKNKVNLERCLSFAKITSDNWK